MLFLGLEPLNRHHEVQFDTRFIFFFNFGYVRLKFSVEPCRNPGMIPKATAGVCTSIKYTRLLESICVRKPIYHSLRDFYTRSDLEEGPQSITSDFTRQSPTKLSAHTKRKDTSQRIIFQTQTLCINMRKDIDQGEPCEDSEKSGDSQEPTQNQDAQNKKDQSEKVRDESAQNEKPPNYRSQTGGHQRPNFSRAPTADSVLASMSGDPKTTRQLDTVMSQLDAEGKAQLSDLVSRFASGARRKGRIDETEAYREQNPWHDTPRERPVFSLGEPFPRKDGSDPDSASVSIPDTRPKEKPVFSLGEPLPHKVRRMQRQGTAGRQPAEDDVEQGLRQRPQKEQRDDTSPDSQKTTDTGETLHGTHTRQSMASVETQKTHRGSQDQGTDTAQQFRVSDIASSLWSTIRVLRHASITYSWVSIIHTLLSFALGQ